MVACRPSAPAQSALQRSCAPPGHLCDHDSLYEARPQCMKPRILCNAHSVCALVLSIHISSVGPPKSVLFPLPLGPICTTEHFSVNMSTIGDLLHTCGLCQCACKPAVLTLQLEQGSVSHWSMVRLTRAVICAGAIMPVTFFSSCSFSFLFELWSTVYVKA